MHSHYGVDPAPGLKGTDDTNSLKAPILPWLRSLDGINTHDLAFNLSIAGGITTSLILPGSAGNIGGQAFTIKPRWTAENTPQSMQVSQQVKLKKNEN
jgi:imidazolonepropionase-like amidohydrolase